jgi:uncharacterized protein YecE (DUF72 family)
MAVRIGISGFRYDMWRGVFYPKGLRQADELAFAAAKLDSIELNGSFYSLQRPELYARWRAATPDDFVFAVKGGRFITHMRRLLNVETGLANFFASGVLRLEEKLGPILWQFPESQRFDERFERFFEMLPRDTREASRLARRHDERLTGRAAVRTNALRPLRHAIEVRSPTFLTNDFVRLLRRFDIALVVADTAGRWPYVEDVTADFVYVRLHGDEKLYESGYSPAALARWANRVRAWSRGSEPSDAVRISKEDPPRQKSRDVYVYFDNDIKVHAPFDAIELARRLGVGRDAGRPFGHPRGALPRAQKRRAG